MPIETGPIKVWRNAANRRSGMTFGELRQFVQDGMRVDIPDDAPVQQVATWRGTTRRLQVHQLLMVQLMAGARQGAS